MASSPQTRFDQGNNTAETRELNYSRYRTSVATPMWTAAAPVTEARHYDPVRFSSIGKGGHGCNPLSSSRLHGRYLEEGEEGTGRDLKRRRTEEDPGITGETEVTQNGIEDEFETESEASESADESDDEESLSNDGHALGGVVSSSEVPLEVNICQSEVDADDVSMGGAEASSEDESDGSDSETEDDTTETDESDCCSEDEEEESVSSAPARKMPTKIHFMIPPAHELFLPCDTSPSFEDLKYESDDSSDDEDDSEEAQEVPQPAPIVPRPSGNRGLFRQWREKNQRRKAATANEVVSTPQQSLPPPSSTFTNVADSASLVSDDSSNASICSEKPDLKPKKSKAGVTFGEQVVVRSIFKASVYPSFMKEAMYTNRFELRAGKIKNRREFGYERFDWRNALEEGDMVVHPRTGRSVHPAHLHVMAQAW